MLIDEPRVFVVDPILALVAQVNGNSSEVKRLQCGIYERGDFGSSAFMRDAYEHYPELGEHNAYGVCDDVANVLEVIKDLQDPDRKFVVMLSPVRRNQSNAGNGGGWRWHKWGPYIGKHEPTTEYLDDEPLIELVYCYHIYEQVKVTA